MDSQESRITLLVGEYDNILKAPGAGCFRVDGEVDWDRVEELLNDQAEWTGCGAHAVASLARSFGTFVLRNALALAVVLDIEDGEVRI